MKDSILNHSSADYATSVLEAVEIIVDRYVSQAGFDKTIQATVLSCTSSTKGEYKCKYQDSKFYAYAPNPDTTYAENTLVYILIPGNDWDATKTILGTVDKLGKDYISNISKKEYFDSIGTNIVDNPSMEIHLTTWEDDSDIILYDYDQNINNIQLNIDKVNDYVKNAEYLKIQADFQTHIEDQTLGYYGIRIKASVPDSNEVRVYELRSTDMIGNPNHFITYTPQQKIVALDSNIHFDKIIRIEAFVDNYSQAPNHQPDVFIKNFNFVAQRRLTEAEMAGGHLSIETDGGAVFYKDSQQRIVPSIITLKGIVRVDGIPTQDSNIKYYWFVQDSRSYSGSPLEHDLLCQLPSIDTQGWACLNSYSEEGGSRLWQPAGNLYDLTPDKVVATSMKYKCVAIYDDMIMEAEVTIENRSANYNVYITSENGTDFFKDQGDTTLTCNIEIGSIEPPGELSYYWCSYSSTGMFNTYSTWGYQSEVIPAISIVKFTRYVCSVYAGPYLVGSAEITLYNKDTTTTGTYQLNIIGGDQIFIYDEDNCSPVSAQKEYKQLIKGLELAFYDNLAKRIDNETVIQTSKVRWLVPKDDTMLIITSDLPHYEGEDEDEGYIVYEDTPTLSFNIKDYFDMYLINNQIKLTVEYNGNVYIAYTSLYFDSQGGLGTNGTQYTCRIVPRIDADATFNESRVVIKELSTGDYSFNFNALNISTPFKVDVYRENQRIFSDYLSGTSIDNININVEWSICGKSTNSAYDITKAGVFSYNGYPNTVTQPFDNILKAKIDIQSQDGRTIYCFLPITIVKVLNPALNSYIIELKRYRGIFTGFTKVKYNADGDNPQYDYNSTFAPAVFNYNGDDVTSTYTISRSIYGSNIELEDPLYPQSSTLRPSDHYDGIDVNNAVVYTCTNNFVLYCPVVFYINRYGLASLNAWDGTHIDINEDGGYIYAPQMGAGIKENDNSFTGVLLGKAAVPNTDTKVGLLAYGKGNRTVFIDAYTGRSEFGAGRGKIIIEPDDNNRSSCIYGGGYDLNPNTGMCINLSEPSIKWGNGNFQVNSEGQIVAIKMNLKRGNNDTYYSIDEYGLLLDVGDNGAYSPVRPPSAGNGHKVLIYNSEINPEDSKVNGDYKTNAIGEFGKDGIIFQSTRGSFFYMKDVNDYSDKGPNTTLSSANALYLRSGMLNNIPDPGPADEDAENYTTEASVTMKAAYNANIWAGHGLSLRVTGPHDRDDPNVHQNWPPAVLNSKYGYMKLETQYGWIYLSDRAGGKNNTPGIGINAYTWEYRQNKRGESEDDPLPGGTPYPGRDYKVYINGNEVLDSGNAADATGGDLGGAVYVSEFGNLRPYLNNLVSLGSYYEEGDGIAAWRHVVTYDTIQVSDRREKAHIQDLDKRYIDFIMNLRPKKYKYLKTREDEYRTGFIAQEVETCLDEVGLRNKDFGGLKKKPIIMDGKTVDYGYGLNYDDFVAALVLTVQDLQKQINDLKGELKNGIRNVKE